MKGHECWYRFKYTCRSKCGGDLTMYGMHVTCDITVHKNVNFNMKIMTVREWYEYEMSMNSYNITKVRKLILNSSEWNT